MCQNLEVHDNFLGNVLMKYISENYMGAKTHIKFLNNDGGLECGTMSQLTTMSLNIISNSYYYGNDLRIPFNINRY